MQKQQNIRFFLFFPEFFLRRKVQLLEEKSITKKAEKVERMLREILKRISIKNMYARMH